MPELPEVETIIRGLEKKILGKIISKVESSRPRIFSGDPEVLKDREILNIKRRAKMIIFNLSDNLSLLIHLKMTGQLVFDEKKGKQKNRIVGGHPSADWMSELPNKHTHVIFYFKDKSVLYYNDMMRFGFVRIYPTDMLDKTKELSKLGPEPFLATLSPDYLMKVAEKHPKTKIKQIIMDQSNISGIGNIYADEILFCARISPLRLAGNVKKKEWKKLIECVRTILETAIKHGGSTIRDFLNAEGKKGKMQNYFKVYQRTGKECVECGGEIVRIKIVGRGTHYCPTCQK